MAEPAAARSVRTVALHLPQFHPVAENDAWWGKGFTEWTNVTRARRLFPGHDQPRLPADLGFYDLRLPEALTAQAELARAHGLEAFVFWHYWFAGRRMLERPLDIWRSADGPQFGFALAWANQTWRGHWHGTAKRVLIEQTYPPGDDERHFAALLPSFSHERYVRIDGKPLFYIFRGEELPNPRAFVDKWQAMAQHAGLPGLWLVAEVNDPLGRATYDHPTRDGFDAGVDLRLPARRHRRDVLLMRTARKLGAPETYPYASTPIARRLHDDGRLTLPAVVPNWDNTPRSGRNGLVLRGSTPARFRSHVRSAVQMLQGLPADQRLLIVKSWNEWAEGNYLEPDQTHGRGYLDVLDEETRAGTLARA